MNPSWSDDQESHAINDSERARLAFAPFPSSPLAASQPLDLYQSYNTSSSRPDPVSQNLADGGPLAPPPVQTCNPKDLHVSIQSHVPRDQTEHDRAENEYRSQSTPQTPTQHLSTPWHDPETAIVKDNAKGNRRGQTRSSNYDNERAQRVKEVFACVFCQAVNVKCSDDPAVACPKCKTKERDCFRWKILSSIVAKWTVGIDLIYFRTVANALPEPEDDGEMRLQFSIRSRDSEGCEVRLELRRGDDNPDYILESERNIYAFDRLARESVIGALNHSQRDDTPATRDLEQKAFTWAGYYVMLMGMQVAEYRVEIPDSWLVGQIKGLHSAEEHFGSQFPQAATQVSIQVLGFFGRRFTQLTKELLESSSTYVKDTKPAYKTRTALAIIYRVCLQHRFSAQQAIPGLRKLLSPITEMMESLSTELQKAGKAVYCMGIASGNISPSKTFDAFAIALMPSVKVPPLIVGYEYNSTREDLRLDARPKSLPPVDR
ncbi:MAG: hypothetical protein M1833_004197 [Piccolia ochrophora]|nr:MAG: hypothetical protein M1833_004197 [Piccolia ochrophora]